MTEFMVLLRSDRNELAGMAPEARAKRIAEWNGWADAARAEGRIVRMSPFGLGARVVHAGGRITEGPHPAADGHTLRAHMVVRAESLDDAAAWVAAQDVLSGGGGKAEIHPLVDM